MCYEVTCGIGRIEVVQRQERQEQPLWLASGYPVSTFETQKGRSHFKGPPFFLVRVVLQFALRVENHGGTTLRRESRPVGDARMIGVAVARKLNPRLTDVGGERPWSSAASRQVLGAVGIVEAKRQIDAMNGARPAVQDRRFPGEPIEISRRALRGFEPGLKHRTLTDLRGHGQREDVKRLRAWM